MNRGYDWRLGKIRSIATDGKVIYDTALSCYRLSDALEHTYDPLLGTLGALLNQTPDYYLDGLPLDNGKVVMGWDDAYADVLTLGLPIFQAKNIDVDFYLQTGFVGDTGAGAMTWAQVATMYASGKVNFEAHFKNFGQLTLSDAATIEADIIAMNADFTSHSLPIPEHVAYPGGYCNDMVLGVIDDYFKTGRTVINGYINRKSSKYTLPAFNLSYGAALYPYLDYAKANNLAIHLYGHRVGNGGGSLYITETNLSNLIDYAKGIGLDFITSKQLYELMFYIDLRLSRYCASNQIDVIMKNRLGAGYSISLERSDDGGVNYTEIALLDPGEFEYSDTGLTLNKNYFYRARGVKDGEYLPYSRIDSNTTAIGLTLAATGNGTGVATLDITSLEDTTLTIDGNGKFYTDAAGTTGETTSVVLSADVNKKVYIKVTSGTSNFTISQNRIKQINGWTSGTNAPSLGGSIAAMTKLQTLIIIGNNTVSGSISAMVDLNILNHQGAGTISGDISNAINLTYVNLTGANNTVTANITNLTKLTFVEISAGTGNITGSITNLIHLTYFKVSVPKTNDISGSINGLTSLTYIYCGNNCTIAGDVSLICANVTSLIIGGKSQLVDYTSGGNWNKLSASGIVILNATTGYGYSATEVDNIIIDIATTKVAGRAVAVTIQGASAARTAASNTARNTIVADGGSVITN